MNSRKIGAIVFLIFSLCIIITSGITASNKSNGMASKTGNNDVNCTKIHYEDIYGSTDADVYKFKSKSPKYKVAFILGVHPYEHEAHKAFYDAILQYISSPEFRGQIDVYWIRVPPENGMKYKEGREIGAKSTNSFAVPIIKDEKYGAVFDVHSGWQGWPYQGRPKWFILYGSENSKSFSHDISKNLEWASTLGKCSDKSDTSGYWITNPIAQSGASALILEWGWCEPEYLWLKKGEINLDAKDPGEYEAKFKHALLFLDEINGILENTD